MQAAMTQALQATAPALLSAQQQRGFAALPRRMTYIKAQTTRPQVAAAAIPGSSTAQELTIRFEDGTAILSLPAPVSSAAPPRKSAAEEAAALEVLRAQFDRWNDALQTGDPEQVASLYAPNAVLLPTVSNHVRTDHAGKVDYFTAFLKLKPVGHINESHVRFLTPDHNIGINSGVYTFDIVKDEEPQKVQARYSFVYTKSDGDWHITEHHSSAMPEFVANPLDEVAAQFERWNDALQTGDPEQVASLYAPNALLLPTVSNRLRTDHAGKVDYFTAFLMLKPVGTINESHIRFLTPDHNVASNSGIYTFYMEKDGEPQTVQARYSFVYRKVNGDWQITEHHSSAMPEPLELATA